MAISNIESIKVKRLKSCYICGVEVYDSYIVLEDSVHAQYLIDKSNATAVESFATWFKSIFLKCIPQTLTVIDYSIGENKDGEAVNVVNKIIFNHEKCCMES